MKQTRKMQRLHELQVTRSIMTETGRITINANKDRQNDSAKYETHEQERAKED